MRSCEEAVIRRHLLLTKTSDQAEKRRVQWRLGGVGSWYWRWEGGRPGVSTERRQCFGVGRARVEWAWLPALPFSRPQAGTNFARQPPTVHILCSSSLPGSPHLPNSAWSINSGPLPTGADYPRRGGHVRVLKALVTPVPWPIPIEYQIPFRQHHFYAYPLKV